MINVNHIFEQFSEKRILVLGDVMIDSYLTGTVSRVSPEAPVPIVSLKKAENRLGGAANVALNLQALGATPVLVAVVGKDDGGALLVDLLENNELSSEGIVTSSQRKTTRKTRVIGNHQHLLRIDEEETHALNNAEEERVIAQVEWVMESGVDAVILEDYNKGLLTPHVIQSVIQLANDRNIIVTVDPKKDHFLAYRNVTLFKPNLKELKEGLNVEFDFGNDKNAFEKAIDALELELNHQISFVTLSEHGVFVKDKQRKSYIPAHIRNIADVSGAGDTVISVATLCLTAGLSPNDMAAIANLAGGLVCERSGVVPIEKDLLMKEIQKMSENDN